MNRRASDKKQKVNALIASLHYDFKTFALKEFVSVAKSHIQRRIAICPADIKHAQGAWISSPDTEYIYYRQGLSGVSLERTIIHEIGHMLLGHDTYRFGETHNGILFLMTSQYTTNEELEAELFVAAVFGAVDTVDTTFELLNFIE